MLEELVGQVFGDVKAMAEQWAHWGSSSESGSRQSLWPSRNGALKLFRGTIKVGTVTAFMSDPFNLNRFIEAQRMSYTIALSELKRGRKESHWIWYIFPQVVGLGQSEMAKTYAIGSREEGLAYLNHDVLGPRLHECAGALMQHNGRGIREIMGSPDDLKLRSSLTLFAALSEPRSGFHQVIEVFYGGELDPFTVAFLA